MSLAIRAGTLIDGSGRDPVKNAVILVDDQTVKAAGPAAEVAIPHGYKVIDASQYTVMPGLIDSHLHLIGSGEPGDSAFGVGEVAKSIPAVTLACAKNALKDLEAGWTTVRDAGSRYYADIALRDAINRGDMVGPRIWCSGIGLTSTAGHMDREKYLAPHMPAIPGASGVADGPVEGRRAVRQNLRFDVDFFKINATLTEHVRRYQGYCAPEMTKETMAAIFEEAHWHGRKVTAHCYGGDGATWAIEAGIDGIEHGFYLTDTHLEMMAEKGVVLCPTLSVAGRFREMGPKALPAGSPHLEAWRKKAVAHAWDMVRRAKRIGVTIVAGTDAAMPYVLHGGNAYELEMLVEAGLTPMEAIVAATGTPARVHEIPGVGLLEEGRFADLIMVDGDPLSDIRILQDLSRIPVVMKGGQIVADRRSRGGEAQ